MSIARGASVRLFQKFAKLKTEPNYIRTENEPSRIVFGLVRFGSAQLVGPKAQPVCWANILYIHLVN